MIFTKRKITITGDKASMDKQIVLYRGDREVEVQFEIIYETIKYRKTNAIEDVNASFGQLVIQNDSGAIPTVTDVSPTSEGVVVFKFTKEMIDEITELGTYDFQIRLFDDTQTSRITTPAIENSIIIKEPLSMYEGDTAEVGVAVTGVAKIQEEEYLEPFDEAGNYNETTWATGDIITSGKLNKLEDGITGVNQKVENITIPTKTSELTNDSNFTTKKYVDDKTEILPVKNNYIIFEDTVPSRTEVASDGLEYYIFDSLQNEDMIISAVKYNLNVTFNDGTNDRTMDLIIERSLKGGASCEKDGFVAQVSYSETKHTIEMVLINANDYTQYSILKAALNYDCYSNLLQDYHIENIDYDKIKGVPTALNRIADHKDFTLKDKEYYNLYDNLFIWDANKINERLDENSGVKRNEFFKSPGKDKYTIRIKQKDSEGIGFGQHISIDNSKNVRIVLH